MSEIGNGSWTEMSAIVTDMSTSRSLLEPQLGQNNAIKIAQKQNNVKMEISHMLEYRSSGPADKVGGVSRLTD